MRHAVHECALRTVVGRSSEFNDAMRANRSIPATTVIPVLTYPDVRAAVAWLEDAFGFAERVRIGEDHRAQLSFGDGGLIVADTGGARTPPDPAAVTHSVMVRVPDARAIYERAREHDAQIASEPTDFPYGERQFSVTDPWGHHWIFSETIADTAPEDWGGSTVAPS